MAALNNLNALMVRFWTALVLNASPTRRAGAVPVAVADPFSKAKSMSWVGAPMTDATAIGDPPGVPQ